MDVEKVAQWLLAVWPLVVQAPVQFALLAVVAVGIAYKAFKFRHDGQLEARDLQMKI